LAEVAVRKAVNVKKLSMQREIDSDITAADRLVEEPDNFGSSLATAQSDYMPADRFVELRFLIPVSHGQDARDELASCRRQSEIYEDGATSAWRRFAHPFDEPIQDRLPAFLEGLGDGFETLLVRRVF